MCIYSPMPHTLSYCALIGKCALIRSNTVIEFENSIDPDEVDHHEPPHLDLHCLLVIVFEWERLFEIMQK